MLLSEYIYMILIAGWLIWVVPFLLIRRTSVAPAKIDRRARWGILLQALAYSMLWWNHFWLRSPHLWRIALSVLFFTLAGILSWTAPRALGRQWRIDAGVNPDHELVRSGPYRVIRHPIYTSMFCTLLGTGFLLAPLWVLLISSCIFLTGAEIRMRVEDSLLSAQFGEKFEEYRRSVPAYIPFLR